MFNRANEIFYKCLLNKAYYFNIRVNSVSACGFFGDYTQAIVIKIKYQ